MGDIFCLIILESGSRRKLKLRKGTYDELLSSLRSLADVELENTLIQVFDTDLEDFVDLLPDDTIENKAKLRIIQKNTPKRISGGACSDGLVPLSHPQHNGIAAGSVPCQQQQLRPPVSEEANSVNESALICDAIKVDLPDDSCFVDGESICRIGEVFSQAFPEELEDDADQPAEPPEKTVANGDINSEESAGQPQQSKASGGPDVEDGSEEPGDPVVRLSQLEKMLALLAAKPGGSRGEKMSRRLAPPRPSETAELAARPEELRFEFDKSDHLKFTLPTSFGGLCDTFLARRAPISKNLKRLIVAGLFNQCMKITMYPSRKLYSKAIDSLLEAHPHVIQGGIDRSDWVRALRFKFKNVRRRLPEGVVPVKYRRKKLGPRRKPPQGETDDSEQSDHSDSTNDDSPAKEAGSTNTPEQSLAKNTADAEARPSSPADSSGLQDGLQEEVVNGLSSSATPLKEVTVFELLDMCTREPITPQKLFRPSNLEWHDDEDDAGSQSRPIRDNAENVCTPRRTESIENIVVTATLPHLGLQDEMWEERANAACRTDTSFKLLQDPNDYLQFELPSLGIYEDCVAKKALLTGRMRRYIVNCLFESCYKITMYPSSNLYRTAVDALIEKYPHLRDTTGETGREIWNESLRAKFKNIRRTLPGHMWDPEAAETQPGEKSSAKRLKFDETRQQDDVKRVFRPSSTDFTGGHRGQGPSVQLSPGQLPSAAELAEAQKRHDRRRDMSVSVAIMAFPSFKQEPSLLAEFRTLWRRDIGECFEKGIKRMFLVLMNSGSADEIAAFTQRQSDILMVVLNATAARCGEKLDSILTENTTLATPCLVKRANGNLELFVAGYFLFTASSLLGGVCALFATFWVFHIEYPKNARSILTFLEHAFLDLRQTKPHVRCYELINQYRSSSV
ncbi:uncharacterized protein LOC144138367 [Haemaphysalis longicornis]